MSDFSDLLDHAIARSNLSMLELQEASGIPISYLYKLRKGVRFTKKYTPNVLSLIYALQCPKAEEARLLQEFRGGGLAAIFDAVNLLTPARIETQAALWDEALAQLPPAADAVRKVVAARLRGRPMTQEDSRKLAVALQRRGFSWNDIRPVLNEWGQEIDET